MAVSATNFQEAGNSTWGFHHVRELHPSARVWRGGGPLWELPRDDQDIGSIDFAVAGGTRRTVAQMVATNHVDGLAVLHRGRLVFEVYGSGMRAQDTHILMSSTKSFTGSLAGILIEQGCLSVGDLVTGHLPELAGTAYDGANVRHLLDMRVGLDFSEAYDDPESDFAYMDAAAGWRPPVRPGAPDHLAAFIAAMRARPPHGGPFHYVSPNAVVLGWVLEAASGERFADLLSRLIWQPMAAEFDADLVLDRLGRSQTEGGLNVALRDFARFGELHRLGGMRDGHRIVPTAWIEDLRASGDPDAWERGTMAAMMPGHHYRSQWYTNRGHPRRPFFTAGAFGQSVFVDPTAETVVAMLSSFPPGGEDRLFDEMFRAFYAIADAFSPD